MMNVLYNNTYQIQQAKDHVVIVVEMNHDARIIRLADKRRGRPSTCKPGWATASAAGRATPWSSRPSASIRASAAPLLRRQPLPVAETPRSPSASPASRKDQILYQFKVDDPEVYFTRPGRARCALNATKGPVYEYACHEGNYAPARHPRRRPQGRGRGHATRERRHRRVRLRTTLRSAPVRRR